jgi:hypothetical protein
MRTHLYGSHVQTHEEGDGETLGVGGDGGTLGEGGGVGGDGGTFGEGGGVGGDGGTFGEGGGGQIGTTSVQLTGHANCTSSC